MCVCVGLGLSFFPLIFFFISFHFIVRPFSFNFCVFLLSCNGIQRGMMREARVEVDLKFNYVYSRRTKGVCFSTLLQMLMPHTIFDVTV